MPLCAIGLGSNLSWPCTQLARALFALQSKVCAPVIKASCYYQSRPYGCTLPQPDYVNQMVLVRTRHSPHALLAQLQKIEAYLGRAPRSVKAGYQPRTIDLDIIWYQDYAVQSALLTIPHPGISVRDFFYYPLAEVAPEIAASFTKPEKKLRKISSLVRHTR